MASNVEYKFGFFGGGGVDGANFSLWLNLIDYAYAALSLPGKI